MPLERGFMAGRTEHYRVYIVALRRAVLTVPKFLSRNRDYVGGKPAVYVGVTGIGVAERLENHKAGIKASRWVRKYGKHLRRSDMERLGLTKARSYEVACRLEQEVASLLRSRGWAVWQN
jgi:hypothetical protein